MFSILFYPTFNSPNLTYVRRYLFFERVSQLLGKAVLTTFFQPKNNLNENKITINKALLILYIF